MRLILALVAFARLSAPSLATEIHAAPAENLEAIDGATIAAAHHRIDMAAYVLTDGPVMAALRQAASRNVVVRIYLDGRWAGTRGAGPDGPFGLLLATPGIEIRDKRAGAPLMHLKSYCIDGHIFRTGSANFSPSGLRRQDNDLILFDDASLCSTFEARFDAMWSRVN